MALVLGSDNQNPTQPLYTQLTDLEGVWHKLADKIEKTFASEWKTYLKYGNSNSNPEIPFRVLLPSGELTTSKIMQLVQANPYCLTNVRGISFGKADKIALENFYFDRDDPRRHEAGNYYILQRNNNVLPMWRFKQERQRLGLLNPDYEMDGVVLESGLAWTPAELAAERILAEFWAECTDGDYQDSEILTNLAEQDNLNAEQLKAVKCALSGVRCMALTGGAGTGKTKTLASVVKAAKAFKQSVRIMTFAGKAAQRAAEAMRENHVPSEAVECSTIHRALGLAGTFRIQTELLAEKIIVLDEASMIPNWLLAEVVKALRPDATLILVGDPNQLPPIGYGNPFSDLLEAELPHVHLVTNYRQKNQQSIFMMAEAIRKQKPDLYQPSATGVQTHFSLTGDKEETLIESLMQACLPLGLHNFQVLTWTNIVREALNDYFQKILNPNGEEIFRYAAWEMPKDGNRPHQQPVREGDKVLITDNAYDFDVFNGQTGIVLGGNWSEIEIDLGFKTVTLPLDIAEDIVQLGYCISVHKSQGTGWDAVILYQPEEVPINPRKLYYTSVTRAKNQFYLVTGMSESAFWKNACLPDRGTNSTLLERIFN